MLNAEGDRQAAILRAEGEAKAIDTVFTAIHEGKPDRELLSYEYLQMLPQLAEGDANKVFVVPSEFAEAFGGIGEALRGTPGLGRPAAPGARRRRPPPHELLSAGTPAPAGRGGLPESTSDVRLARREAPGNARGRAPARDRSPSRTSTRAMREIRLALLEADVNFKVVRQFTSQLKERCLGAEVIGKLNPGQQVVKIVGEELTALMGGAGGRAQLLPRPADRDPDGRPAGLGQDDRGREARALSARGALLARSPWRPATCIARRRSSSS